jgi:predicted adenylyl cyclase CyaB
MEEIEIKFVVKNTKVVTDKLRKLGFRIAVARHLEKNYLFDDSRGSLQAAGKLLRVRDTASRDTVTYKGPILASSKLKHREEIECRVESADIMIRILEEAGFKVRTEYSKYRTVFEKENFSISLDETEAGNYLEVEGPSDQEITNLATKLGYSEKDFVRRTYAELIRDRRGTSAASKKEPS